MVETIKVPANVNYLNNWAGFELPRGIVNKGITGCGATTLAIEDEHKTVICSPRINLIRNKCQQHKGALAVYGDVRNGDIEDYLRNSPKPKLLATYDSVPRLNGLIKDKPDWRIVVDEYQYILIDSGFKSETEIALLETLRDYSYVTYISATPIADKYMRQMDWFKEFPRFTRWFTQIAYIGAKTRGKNNKKRELHRCNSLIFKWYHQESNRGHKDFQSFALPTELWHHVSVFAMQRYGKVLKYRISCVIKCSFLTYFFDFVSFIRPITCKTTCFLPFCMSCAVLLLI